MPKPTFLVSALLFTYTLAAQHTIQFEIKSLPPNHPSDGAVYVSGSFNGWNPKNEQYRFQKDDKGNYFLNLKLDAGSYEYKITRGGWDKVECQKTGVGIANRILKMDSDITVQLNIEEWQDNFKAAAKKSTASKNVKIIETAFPMPQLNRSRRIWIYLPETYNNGQNLSYPVLYMHDGQNVFEDSCSFSGEWGVDEFLDTSHLKTCIVVAIDNGRDKRLNEYCPYDFSAIVGSTSFSGKGEGSLYADFIVQTLKPYIDKHYRTKTDRKNTFIAGSSMGGLISMYAILKYPKVFGGAGVFSPAFWVGPKIFDDIENTDLWYLHYIKIYFYAGGQESDSMISDMQRVVEKLKSSSRAYIETRINENGTHNEQTWRKEFPAFYSWVIKGFKKSR